MLDNKVMEHFSALLEKNIDDKEKWYKILENYEKVVSMRNG